MTVHTAYFFENLPPLSESYEPVLWYWALEKLWRAGEKNGVDAAFRRQLQPFEAAIKETRPFITSRPIRVQEVLEGLPSDDIRHAEPPFPYLWVESSEPKNREVFGYADGLGLIGADGQPVRHAGLWSIQLTPDRNLSLYIAAGADHILVTLLNEAHSLSTKALWCALEPFLRGGWWNVPYKTSFKGRNFNKTIRRNIDHINCVTIIRHDQENIPFLYSSELKRYYAGRWPVRGFWRKLKEGRMGKNSAGEEVVPGKTWVKAHFRGPDKGIDIQKRWRVQI